MADDVISEREPRRVSFDALPHAGWPDIAAVIAGVWPRAAAEHDLRWFAAEHALRDQKLPSVRELAERWTWSRSRVHDLITNESAWRDASRPWTWRTPVGQQSDGVRTHAGQTERTNAGNSEERGQRSDSVRTPVGQQSDSRAFFSGSPVTPSPTPTPDPILSATADPVPSPPEKRKPARKARTGKEPHPFADRVYKAWDRVWEKRMGEGNAYPWNYPVERSILTKCVADPYVSRDPDKGTEHMQLVGAAMTRYLSQEVDGRFVKGLSIKGFAGDVAKWFTPADTAVQIRRGPPEYRSISELLGEAEQPPTANRDAIDVAYRVVP